MSEKLAKLQIVLLENWKTRNAMQAYQVQSDSKNMFALRALRRLWDLIRTLTQWLQHWEGDIERFRNGDLTEVAMEVIHEEIFKIMEA